MDQYILVLVNDFRSEIALGSQKPYEVMVWINEIGSISEKLCFRHVVESDQLTPSCHYLLRTRLKRVN